MRCYEAQAGNLRKADSSVNYWYRKCCSRLSLAASLGRRSSSLALCKMMLSGHGGMKEAKLDQPGASWRAHAGSAGFVTPRPKF